VAESEEDGSNDAADDASNAKATSEGDTGSVAIADGPANEIGVSLVTKSPLNGAHNRAERCGMSGVCQSVQ